MLTILVRLDRDNVLVRELSIRQIARGSTPPCRPVTPPSLLDIQQSSQPWGSLRSGTGTLSESVPWSY